MAISEAQRRAVAKYNAANYERVELRLKRGKKDTVKAHAESYGESLNEFVNRAIDCQMERDGAGDPQEAAGAAAVAGGISLSPDALEAAQQAAERTGEAPAVFVARAIETQAKRDKSSIALGINPATGDKLNQTDKGGADHE